MKQSNRTRLQSRLNSLLSLVLLVAVFGLVAWASTQYTFEQDWTRTGRHTLSEASRQVLEQLDSPIHITAYTREQKPLRDAIRDFVERYQRVKPDITLEFINPERVPDKVRELGISVNGELVLRVGERTEHVKNITEQSLTNAMRRLARGEERVLAFLQGHGERNPRGEANHDLGTLGPGTGQQRLHH
ncbi:MAG: Gldg family protein [Gammaproteobacteria bacterium]|nr:Gldg family protein [Gammaproteobacteria bacterium]